MYGTKEGKLIIVNDWSVSKYSLSRYTPVGVVVVPGSHGHYEDGKCAIMSLNYMDAGTPTTGGNGSYNMMWGIPVSINGLPYLDVVPYIGGVGVVGDTVLGTSTYGTYPSDKDTFTEVDNPYDIKTKYYSSSNKYYIPSPYNNDGTFNPNYSLIDSPSSAANALADFDGYNNTKKILATRGERDYSSWTPTMLGDFPAVSCCDMYSTPGIPQGSWYMPSAGEIGYVCARAQMIDDSLNRLIQGGVDMAVVLYLNLCSSTIIDDTFAWMSVSTGVIQGNMKTNPSGIVRAFAIV